MKSSSAGDSPSISGKRNILAELLLLAETAIDMHDYAAGSVVVRGAGGDILERRRISPDPRTVAKYRRRTERDILPRIRGLAAKL